jgi:transposase
MNKDEALENVAWGAKARRQADDRITLAVARARSAGASWSEIAAPLGITRQRAQQRYADWMDKLPLSDPIFDPLFNAPNL